MISQSFNPAAINSFILYNKDYNVIPVKIRLKNASGPGAINLGPSQSLTFEVRYSSGKAKFYYTLRYNPGSPQGVTDVINFDVNTFEKTFTDNDGIDKGVRAVFTQTIQGSAIQAAISK